MDIDHMQTATACCSGRACPNDISVAGVFVNSNIVRRANLVVVGGYAKSDWRVKHGSQQGQIKDLHTMAAGLRYDKGVIVIYLDVAPRAVGGLGGQITQINRVEGITDVDKGRAIGPSHNSILFVGDRIGPAPDVVAVAAAYLGQR